MTYADLWENSGRLAAWLMDTEREAGPVAVYGHKSPWMLAAFLGCVRAGHAYCPLDVSLPQNRMEDILRLLPTRTVINCSESEAARLMSISQSLGKRVTHAWDAARTQSEGEENWVEAEDLFYIIFTSGSTGKPKGVQITRECLDNFLAWSVGLGGSQSEKEGVVFLNQAPFSFDLSVMDIFTCLACSGTLVCLDRRVQEDYSSLMQELKEAKARVWVSTPSFAELCLAEPSFMAGNLPELSIFLFCGETLASKTAAKLMHRFPGSVIVNTYGPTESTVAVTSVGISESMAASGQPLPVGSPRKGTRIQIRDEEGNYLPEGEKGEIVIWGDTVSTGYFQQPSLTQQAFLVNEEGIRGYRTGDKGYVKDGQLYFCGRMDLQIKMHGYRIELEDIEKNLMDLTMVEQAVVLPKHRGDKVTSLTAFVVAGGAVQSAQIPREEPSASCQEEKNLKPQAICHTKAQESQALCREELQERQAHTHAYEQKLLIQTDPALQEMIKAELADRLPAYMIPRNIRFLTALPMTANGKADRKVLGGYL